MRKQHDLTYRGLVGEKHRQPIDSHAEASVWRHSVPHRSQIIFIDRVRLFEIGLVQTLHLFKTRLLLDRIVELGESIAHFHPADEELESLHMSLVAWNTLSQRGNVARVIRYNRRLYKIRLGKITKQAVDQFSPACPGRIPGSDRDR